MIADYFIGIKITQGADIYDITQSVLFIVFENPVILLASITIIIKEMWSIAENIEKIDSRLIPPFLMKKLEQIRNLIFKDK
jgi:hypothetical protein